MRRRSFAWLTVLPLVVAACTAAPTPTEPAAEPCTQDLAARTSPTDFPVGVLYVNGDDLPPVIGDVEWLGAAEPVRHEPPLPVHLERFIVLQTRGEADVSLRMTDAVEIAAWSVDAVPEGTFRIGDFESGRERWSEGDEEMSVVCVPVRNGQWAVIADVTFADDAGHGTYYWRLNISETPDS
jgi:hypothetical protein